MGWGCNPSFARDRQCPYCGTLMIDDSNDETSHMKVCSWRTPWRAFMWRWFRRRSWPTHDQL